MLHEGFQIFLKREFFKMILVTYGGNIILCFSIIYLFAYILDYACNINWMPGSLNENPPMYHTIII
ncbi:hypothetical protein C1645_883102 [Glomus cerebriforme]|uniref:Uncharacterized protein n=1 Tax=Glomus cerebriforme TaxID=658196 RepID=A0A397RZC7_9GLOM|nr:hypothetical protein C1645_883102 [Glomus cerebriforme]